MEVKIKDIFMKHILNKKAFTLAEALVAMLLVAVMAAGIITALMSTKRAIIAPSNKEDMIFAVEKAASLLQMADEDDTVASIFGCNTDSSIALSLTSGCSRDSRDTCHNIDCLLPSSCQGAGDYFVYDVSKWSDNSDDSKKEITFMINCAGESI